MATFDFSERTLYRSDCATCQEWHEAPVKTDLIDWCIDHSQQHMLSKELGAQLAGRVYTKATNGSGHDGAGREATADGFYFYAFNDKVFAVPHARLPEGWRDGVVHIRDVPDA